MITVNDKLRVFKKHIIDTRQKAYDEKVRVLEDKMTQEFAERKVLLEKDRKRYEQTLLKGVKAERNQRLSNARSEKKRRLLKKRRDMIETLLDGVKAYTKSFVHSDDYLVYLEKVIKRHQKVIEKLGEFELYMNEYDYKLHQYEIRKLFRKYGLLCMEAHVYEQPIIGGVILVKEDGSTRIDLSVDSVIEDNRTYMGQLIYDILKEAGEISG